MVMRNWKVGDFCCVTDADYGTLYKIKEIDGNSVLTVYYNFLTGVEYNGGYTHILTLRRPTHDQFANAINEHLQEVGHELPSAT